MRKTHLITKTTEAGNTVCGTKMKGKNPIWVTRYKENITCEKCKKLQQSDVIKSF